MPKQSAGILLYRKTNGHLEFFLVHPGGPFFKNKDDGAWSIPKGVVEQNLPIARDALNLLGRKAPTPETPWSDDLRATLIRVLITGRPAIAKF